jgi:hypothetical protein
MMAMPPLPGSQWYLLVVGGLVVWRLTHLLQAEDGPWGVVLRLRAAAGNGMLGALMDCFYCLSVWIALPFAALLAANWLHGLLLWPALSAAAILLDRATGGPTRWPQGPPQPAVHDERSNEER